VDHAYLETHSIALPVFIKRSSSFTKTVPDKRKKCRKTPVKKSKLQFTQIISISCESEHATKMLIFLAESTVYV
jgi:hypothetical protein